MTSAAFANDFKENDYKEGIQQDAIAKKWQEENYSCEMWIDPPHMESVDTARADKIILLVSGVLEIHMDGQVFKPEVGQEIRIPAGTRYVQKTLGRTTACWLYGYRKL